MFFTPEFLRELEKLATWLRRRRGRRDGEKASARRGGVAEFFAYRPYTVGDDWRLIDWHIYARLEQLYIKIFSIAETTHLKILIDNGARMTAKFSALLPFVAALTYLTIIARRRLTLQTLDAAGKAQVLEVSDFTSASMWLEKLTTVAATPPSRLSAVYRNEKLNGKVWRLILSDFLEADGGSTVITDLARRGGELTAIQILTPQEIAPNFSGAINLCALDGGKGLKIDSERGLMAAYRRTFAAYTENLRLTCRQVHAEFYQFNTATPLREMLYALRCGW